jgi:hypothetical protein
VVTNPEKEGKVQCIYDYDPRAENFVGKALPELKVPTLPIIQTIYHNSNNPAMAKVIAEAGNNAKFLDGIVYNGFNDTKNADITASDVKAVEDHVINVYENYWKTDEPGTFDKLIGTVKGWFK